MPKYDIDNPAGRFEDRGTLSLPFLYAISPGCRNNESLIFHLQIGVERFFQVSIHKVRKKWVTFKCVTRTTCKFTVKMKLDPKFVKQIKNAIVGKDGYFENKYEIDFSDPELRKISVWTVLETPGAKACVLPKCQKDYFSFVGKDFREIQGNKSLKFKKKFIIIEV